MLPTWLDGLGESNNPEWKTVACNADGELVAPNGSIGFRWGEKGKWNLEQRADGKDVELKLSLLDIRDSAVSVASLLWRQRKPAFSQRSAVTGDLSPATGETADVGQW